MLDIERDQFRTAQRPGEADQEQRLVPDAGEIGAAGCEQPLDFGSGEGSRATRRFAVGAGIPRSVSRMAGWRVSSGCLAIRWARAMAATRRRRVDNA